MRPDQFQRLHDLQERLADVVLNDADPDFWPGAGKGLAEMTTQERGDRLWTMRCAAAAFMLLERTTSTLEHRPATEQTPEEADAGMAERVRARENEAASVLAKAMKKAKGVTLGGSARG